MKKIIRDYLTFNKRERNGVFVLIAIITLLILYLSVSDIFLETKTVDFAKFEKEIEVLQGSATEEKNYSQLENKTFIKNKPKQEIEYFNFDPNNLPDADWKRLGLSDKQIHTIKNYESKGGKFKTKGDIKKMYCIPEKMYLSLEPYIQIALASPSLLPAEKNRPARTSEFIHSGGAEVKNPKSPVELNSADSI
ncbi:MAG: hypothetical protein H0W84_03440, partial [Bacteroidetes bacterium]|nr:hypothetical protein [Bacteroidota bacterium]